MPDASSEHFYQRLTPIRDFADCLDDKAYTEVPADWIVLLSDVRDSTSVIQSGRYKAVNMVGAATITAILNVCDGADLPYVFGGDGATVLIPPQYRDAAEGALQDLANACKKMFDLELRVGAISVAELHEAGRTLGICKFELSPGNSLAFFSGDGHAYATDLLKSGRTGESIELATGGPSSSRTSPDLAGLSCRWDPIASRNGHIVTLIIQPLGGGDDERARSIVTGLETIIGGRVADYAPIQAAGLRFRWPTRGFGLEARSLGPNLGRLRAYMATMVSCLGQLAAERSGKRLGDYEPAKHHREIETNTDYRKLDGLIRIVLDISETQASRLRQYLEAQYEAGELNFGMHVSDAALMTCLVFDLSAGRHVHFIDGAGGGHTLAAVDLKARATQRQAS